MIYYTHIKKPSSLNSLEELSLKGFSFEEFSFKEGESLLLEDERTEYERTEYKRRSFESLSLTRKIERILVKKAIFKIVSFAFKDSFNSYKLLKHDSGKPYLKNIKTKQSLFLSYSHSKNSVALALSEDVDLGVDIESLNRFKRHRAFKKWLHPEEINLISKMNEMKESLEVKVSVWTRKEALTKLTGLGYKLRFKDQKVYPDDTLTFAGNNIKFISIKMNDEILSIAYGKDKEPQKLTAVASF